jgi:hypothetical protein
VAAALVGILVLGAKVALVGLQLRVQVVAGVAVALIHPPQMTTRSTDSRLVTMAPGAVV